MSSDNSPPPNYNQPYGLSSRIMVSAIIVLFLVVFFILCLHVYAKWFWRHSSPTVTRNVSWRRRHRLDFAGQDPFIIGGNAGLDKAVIDSLPVFVYKPPQKEEAILECAVCLCEFEENENGRLLPTCNHSFHTQCIDMWFHSHSTCPLCRTTVTPEAAKHEHNASTEASSPSSLHQHLAQSLQQRMGGIEAEEETAGISLSHTTEDGALREDEEGLPLQNQSIAYPSHVMFWGDNLRMSSRLSSPRLGREFSSTRSLPQIAIDIPSRRATDAFTSPRCLSLNLTRCSSTDEQACSSPSGLSLKSPASIRMSIRRLLSRERKVFPSDQERAEFDQDTTLSPV